MRSLRTAPSIPTRGPEKPELLVITSSACTLYSREAIHVLGLEDRVGILKLGTTWPLPPKLLKKHLGSTTKNPGRGRGALLSGGQCQNHSGRRGHGHRAQDLLRQNFGPHSFGGGTESGSCDLRSGQGCFKFNTSAVPRHFTTRPPCFPLPRLRAGT